jgi:hypothetical protein
MDKIIIDDSSKQMLLEMNKGIKELSVRMNIIGKTILNVNNIPEDEAKLYTMTSDFSALVKKEEK